MDSYSNRMDQMKARLDKHEDHHKTAEEWIFTLKDNTKSKNLNSPKHPQWHKSQKWGFSGLISQEQPLHPGCARNFKYRKYGGLHWNLSLASSLWSMLTTLWLLEHQHTPSLPAFWTSKTETRLLGWWEKRVIFSMVPTQSVYFLTLPCGTGSRARVVAHQANTATGGYRICHALPIPLEDFISRYISLLVFHQLQRHFNLH